MVSLHGTRQIDRHPADAIGIEFGFDVLLIILHVADDSAPAVDDLAQRPASTRAGTPSARITEANSRLMPAQSLDPVRATCEARRSIEP